MNPNDIGKKLGIGFRVAGRIAQQRAEQIGQNPAGADPLAQPQPAARSAHRDPSPAQRVPNAKVSTGSLTRAAGRGVGGFLRPFGRVGGILWLEVTGFFFGLFALFFAEEIWRTHSSYVTGPMHQRFLIAVVLTAVFGYLCVSAFWRARRK